MDWLRQRFELSRGGGTGNVRPMEGLRGFAVFLVFLVHYVTFIDPWLARESIVRAIAHALHTIGNTGVDLFFVLSGYLIYGMLITRPQPFVRFMTRRVQRIYPAFAVVFAIYVGLSFVFPSQSKIPSAGDAAAVYLAENFLLLPGLLPIEPMITVAWSLSYEMFYYLAIPMVISMFALGRRSGRRRALFFGTLAAAGAIYCAMSGGPVRLVMFLSGILLFEALADGAFRAPGGAVALLALLCGLLSMLLPIGGQAGGALKTAILFASFFLLCWHCFSFPDAWLGTAFSWTPIRWLGNMSYSYYLLHGLTLQAAFLVLTAIFHPLEQGFALFLALLPVMFALSLVPAALLFLLVERPFSLTPRSTGRVQELSPGAGADGPAGMDTRIPSRK